MSTLPDFTGPGFFAGEAPDGLTTIAGTPTSASVRVYWRDSADHDAPDVLVASTQSAADGTWQIAGLNPALRYVVRAQKSQFDDVTVVGAAPSRSDVIVYVDHLEPTEDFDGLTGHVLLDSGLPPFTCEVIEPLPYGLEPVLDGRKLLIEGASDDEGIWNSVVRVTASNGVWVDVPVHAVIGLRAPDIAVRYAAAGDWTITLQLAGGSEFADGLRVYRSTEPLDLEALPDYVAELDADADQWVDADVEPGQTYYYAVVAYVGGAVAMSPVVKREAMWTPADLPAPPKIWLDDESQMTVVSGRVSHMKNRGSIVNANAVQTNSAYRPLLMENELNGKRIVRFDDRLLEVENARSLFRNVGYGWSFYIVRKRTTDAVVAVRQIFYTETGSGLARYADGYYVSANSYAMGRRRLDNAAAQNLVGSAATAGKWDLRFSETSWATATARMRIDGAVDAESFAYLTPGLTSNTDAKGNPTIAGELGFANLGDIDLACVLVSSGDALSQDSILRIEGWAAHRYGLAENLPADHPYKEVAP